MCCNAVSLSSSLVSLAVIIILPQRHGQRCVTKKRAPSTEGRARNIIDHDDDASSHNRRAPSPPSQDPQDKPQTTPSGAAAIRAHVQRRHNHPQQRRQTMINTDHQDCYTIMIRQNAPLPASTSQVVKLHITAHRTRGEPSRTTKGAIIPKYEATQTRVQESNQHIRQGHKELQHLQGWD